MLNDNLADGMPQNKSYSQMRRGVNFLKCSCCIIMWLFEGVTILNSKK